jgi:hypothetical protein
MLLTRALLNALPPEQLHELAKLRKEHAKFHQRAANAAHRDAKRLHAAARQKKASS